MTICHATSATSNPYREQSVDESAVYGNHGHGGHTGGVFDFTNPSSNSGWGDIIPPMGEHPGLNWTPAGQAIHAAGCAAPVAPEPCTYDSALAADDPACTPPAEPDPCTYDNTLAADDPACTPPAEPDPCTYDNTLAADDPACTPPAEPDPCTYDNTLAADDPACTPPAEPDPCTYDNTLAADDPLHPTRRPAPTTAPSPTTPCTPVVGSETAGPPATEPPDDPGTSSGPLPSAAPTSGPREVAAQAVAAEALPRTGLELAPLTAAGLVLILLGGGVLVIQSRSRSAGREGAHYAR